MTLQTITGLKCADADPTMAFVDRAMLLKLLQPNAFAVGGKGQG
jgi:hypothetical protein